MIVRALLVLLAVFVASPAFGTTRYASNTGTGSSPCTTNANNSTACSPQTALGVAVCGDTILLKDGTYTGSGYMLNLDVAAPNKSCSAGAEITVSAENDGAVIIDGQDARVPFNLGFNDNAGTIRRNSFWIFSGFDVGNSSGTAALIHMSNNNIFRRICAYHAGHIPGVVDNEHVWMNWNSSNNLYEDICGFGYGRNTFIDFDQNNSNVIRRAWLSFQGYPPRTTGGNANDHPGPQLQSQYDTGNSSGPIIYENLITVYNPQHQDEFAQWTAGFGAGSATNGILQPFQYTFAGIIAYGYDGPVGGGTAYKTNPKTTLVGPGGGFWWGHMAYPNIDKDLFIDGRSHDNVFPIQYACNPGGAGCTASTNSADRVTVIKGATDNNITVYGPLTNFNVCNTLGGCPNIYTGSGPGTGSRACYEYTNGVLGSDTSTQGLWPWRMDDRIKAALARTSSRALDGAAGNGYAAATVTSEIVSRYGAIPTACLRTPPTTFTPNFPVASDFPSIAVLDTFDRANAATLGANWTNIGGSDFTIASNLAVGPASFSRATYTGNQVTASFHEVFVTLPTIFPCCGFSTLLTFAGTDLTSNNQYRYYQSRQSGGNTLVELRKIDGSGNSTTLISSVDLGIDVVDGNAFGIRVSGTTISMYWKWSDGIWYRVGQVVDATLPTGNVYAGFAGISPATFNDFGAGPAPTTPPTCPPICAPNPAAVTGGGVGRFGNTFPGVR